MKLPIFSIHRANFLGQSQKLIHIVLFYRKRSAYCCKSHHGRSHIILIRNFSIVVVQISTSFRPAYWRMQLFNKFSPLTQKDASARNVRVKNACVSFTLTFGLQFSFTLRSLNGVRSRGQRNCCPHINAHQEPIIFSASILCGDFSRTAFATDHVSIQILYFIKQQRHYRFHVTQFYTEQNDNYFSQGSNLIRIDLIKNVINECVTVECVNGHTVLNFQVSRDILSTLVFREGGNYVTRNKTHHVGHIL